MAIADFHEYVMNEMLTDLTDRMQSKRMFGGYGLYLDGKIFGIITSDTSLYYKVGDNNRDDFIEMGSEQFIYTGHKNKKPTVMPYWKLPTEIMEDHEQAALWAQKAARNTTNG